MSRRQADAQRQLSRVQILASGDHPVLNLDRLSWDNMRLFLAVAEAGSFRAAATIAGVSLNTIRTKVERLEKQIGAPLFIRTVEGVTLTQDGHELIAVAKEMRAIGRGAERVRMGANVPRKAEVRVTVTEGIGTFWLVPRLAELHEQHPDIKLHLTCDMAVGDVLFRDVDIAVQLEKPSSPDLIVQRVATLHLMPFASEDYLRRNGMPTSLDDAENHRLVWQEADQVATDLLGRFVDSDVGEKMIALTTNTSSSHYWAIAKGVGIGFLPTYGRVLSKSIRPIDIGINLRRDVYLVHHPDAGRYPEVRNTLDWLRGAFDRAKYPWFAEEFIHPDELEKRDGDGVVVNLFDSFIDPTKTR